MILNKLLSKKERNTLNGELNSLYSNSKNDGIIIIAKESDPYPGAVLRISIFYSLLLSLVLSYCIEFKYDFILILIPILFLFIIIPIVRIFNLKTFALSQGEMSREVSEQAQICFHKFRNSNMPPRNQFALYISELENRFEFIFGENLDTQLKDSHKEEIARVFKEKYLEKRYHEGFFEAINKIKELLEIESINCPITQKEDDSEFTSELTTVASNDSDDNIKERIFFI